MTARPVRRAARPAGPVTSTTERLTGAWTPEATTPRTGGAHPTAAEPPVPQGVADTAPEPSVGVVRSGRRVTTRPVPGSDPTPSPEPARHTSGENDDRLLRDRPPHWG
ncbi:hypothetical protein [Curtobacterium herbarum]|uniref:Uncharacterized protein n=1 Tax=Curtobacterium herbarum TaxID=150122 RepID=A0ABP4K4C4_9MICO|nr:hypothetical protein [Curtobacterium herbarum]MBM7474288.1 hypothetical protein [Curtobacterium herbarum]MCS6546109.1 hypothetical protein [Curtobacterium herbarum]